MKVVVPKSEGSSKRAPLLPLVPNEEEELNTSNSVSYPLRVKPSENDSPTFKKHVRVLTGDEEVRTMLTWAEDSATVINGRAIQDLANIYTLMVNLLKGSAKTLYTEQIGALCSAAKDIAGNAEADAAAKAALEARSILSFIDKCMC